MLSRLSRYPLTLASAAGLISATGFAPLSLWPLALACFAVLLWLTHEAPSLKSALLRGWLFGVGHFALGNNWIQHAFDYQDKMPPALGYLAVVLLALYLAIYPAMACGLAWRFKGAKPDLAFVFAAAAAWIATEYLRATMFTGYPWSPLGVIWVPTYVASTAAWIGTYALSGVTMLVSGLLYLAAGRNYRPLIVGGVVAIPVLALGWLDSVDIETTKSANWVEPPRVRIVQPNLGQEGVGDPDYPRRALAKLIAQSGAPGPVPRLIVWPEGMVNYYVEDNYPDRRFYYQGDPRWVRGNIAAMLGPNDMALIGGNALFFDKKGELSGAGNSVWPIDSAGMLGARYDKAHLVPYGEYLPMRALLAPLGLARLVMGDVDYVPGPGPAAIPVKGFGNVGVAVCYEIIFSGSIVDRGQRPDLLFNPSNDAWFGTWGPPQHLAQARMRAIEEGLPILRATPTGISAVIDARGRLLGTVPAGQEGAIEVPLPAPGAPTLFARLGNLMALAVALLFVALAVALRRRVR
ncbi:MAG: apolipoprotein N-acyltransferase [Sphingomonadales bacterium]|nr:MAG: apolipoprotein N-acyltransferase [Sphingomonadales bacterium]